MADRGIKLRRYEIENANHYSIKGFRIRVDVAEVSGDMPRDVFVFRRHPPNAYTGEVVDEFVAVASFVDLSEYPVGAPDPEKELPFFRADSVELDARSLTDVEEIWTLLHNEVCSLVNAMDKADVLTVTEDVWCGIAPASSTSSDNSSLGT